MSQSIEVSTHAAPTIRSSAANWFLHSGIQEADGGVARYHYIAEDRNARVSTEITGYFISALLEHHERCAEGSLLDAACRAGDLLCRAWDPAAQAMPFEWPGAPASDGSYSYFFDNGIIVRGLLRLHRATGRRSYLETAVLCGESMRRDFVNGRDIHPILQLPSKEPLARDARWSRSSDCYQMKSALAWLDLSEATGDRSFEAEYEKALQRALGTHAAFLDHEPQRPRIMDRLHAYGYFLEALLPRAERPDVRAAIRQGLERAASLLRAIRHEFERSDVNAQILRVRLWADALGAVPLDLPRAEEEAAWAARYQMDSGDARLNGGFNFGSHYGAPTDYANPVSTAFCMQALAMWSGHRRGITPPDWGRLV